MKKILVIILSTSISLFGQVRVPGPGGKIASGGGGGITLVSSSACVGGTNGGTTVGINTTGADFLVVTISPYGIPPPSITVSDLVGGNSNSWTALTDYGVAGEAAGANSIIYYSANPSNKGSGHTGITDLVGAVVDDNSIFYSK